MMFYSAYPGMGRVTESFTVQFNHTKIVELVVLSTHKVQFTMISPVIENQSSVLTGSFAV